MMDSTQISDSEITTKDLALVVLRNQISLHDHYKTETKWYFPRSELKKNFVGTVKPKLMEFYQEIFLPIVTEYLDVYYRFYVGCNYSFDGLSDSENNGSVFSEYENAIGLNNQSNEKIHPIVDLGEWKNTPLATALASVLTDRLVDRLANIAFKTTVVDRHKGGVALISEITEFEPYGGLDLRGDS